MNRIRKHSAAWASLGIAALAVGCGGPFDASLGGTVTLDGEPLDRGTITFKPNDESGTAAYARIDESGGYRAHTGTEDGLNSGEYQLTVIARADPILDPNAKGPPPAGPMITPKWYRRAQTSGLSYSVEPGRNTYDIELTSTPPPGWGQQGGRNRR